MTLPLRPLIAFGSESTHRICTGHRLNPQVAASPLGSDQGDSSMQDTANQGNLALAENPLNGLGSIVSELTCLIEHVRGSIAAIEAEIARELLCSRTENAAN